jgi:tetratricopeptide (TPR) repeat protein
MRTIPPSEQIASRWVILLKGLLFTTKEAMMSTFLGVFIPVIMATLGFSGCQRENQAVQRPEKILSMREVVYDNETYAQLASLWKKYYETYPSEEAYANWMYAARYAGAANYSSLLEAGAKQYPANPTLLYLKSMLHHGQPQNLEALSLLERAVELDPSYTDPWFALVIHYLERGEQEKMNVALRKILEAGAIADEVMDYSYNMLACLEKDAILVTNGDNDTYPGWILTRVVGYRPDIRIVNQSLLNTDWYPRTLVDEGIPILITTSSLDSLQRAVEEQLETLRKTKGPYPEGGLLSNALIERLVSACRNAGRPVYFAATLQHTDAVKRLLPTGRGLGLVTLVTPSAESDANQIRKVVAVWLQDFRTGGLDGWGIRYARETRAGRMLVLNYGAALQSEMDRIIKYAPDSRLGLFRWYRDHVMALVPGDRRDDMNRMWCRSDDIGEIKEWCRSMNLSK